MIRRILRGEKKLGASRRRSYDIPLNKGAGSGFLTLLISLMTFLAVTALTASFVLGTMSERWSSGLENKVTIEIPSAGESGKTREKSEISTIAHRIAGLLDNHPAVKNLSILSEQEITSLVSPWLGDDISLADVPVPGIISVELKESSAEAIAFLKERIAAIDSRSRLDTHESWLKDLLGFTRALQFGAFLLTLIIGFTTITAIAGAVRARMAVHSAEVELLHIMGASDGYITRQFQRHSLFLGLKGGVIGTIVAVIGLGAIKHLAGEMDLTLLPDFRVHSWQLATMLAMPVFAGMIAMLTARFTVLRTLTGLP